MSLVPHRLQGFWWYPFGGTGTEKNHKHLKHQALSVSVLPCQARDCEVWVADEPCASSTARVLVVSLRGNGHGKKSQAPKAPSTKRQRVSLSSAGLRSKKTKIKGCVRACVCQLRAGKQPCASAICVACINGATHSTHRPQASSLKPSSKPTLLR